MQKLSFQFFTIYTSSKIVKYNQLKDID